MKRRGLRFAEWRGNVTDKDAPERAQEKRRHLIDCLAYVLCMGCDLTMRWESMKAPGSNVAHNNELYGNIVTTLRIKNIVPPSSEPRPQQPQQQQRPQ